MLSCDWLTLSCRANLAADSFPRMQGWHWQQLDGTNIWHNRALAFDDMGVQIGTLCYNPKSTLINKQACTFQLHNQRLYTGDAPRYIYELPFMGITNVGVSRVDICFDFVVDERTRDIIVGLSDGRYYVAGKRHGSQFWQRVSSEWRLFDDVDKIPHCQSWGSKQSQWKWKLYYKSLELAQEGEGGLWAKPYIVDAWQRNGMDIHRVWRLEMSLSSGTQIVFNGQSLTSDIVNAYGVEMFFDALAHRFVVKQASSHKHRSHDIAVEFVSKPVEVYVSEGRSVLQCRTTGSVKVSQPMLSYVASIYKILSDPASIVRRCDAVNMLAPVSRIVADYSLQRYFEAVAGVSYTQWQEDVLSRCIGDDDDSNDTDRGHDDWWRFSSFGGE